MKPVTEAAEAAYAHTKKLIDDASEGSKKKSGWFPDYELEKAFLAGVAWRDANPSPEVLALVEACTCTDKVKSCFTDQMLDCGDCDQCTARAAFESAKAGGAE